MRNPAMRVLLVAILAAVLLAGAGVVVSGDAPSSQTTGPYDTAHTLEPATLDSTATSSRRSTADGLPRADHPSQIDPAFEPDSETRIRVDLQPDRSAEWEIAVRYELDDENETAPFERVGDRFLDGEIGPDPALFERFAADASTNVDRDMEILDVDRDVEVIGDPDGVAFGDDDDSADGDDPPAAVGELRLTFVWTEFLAEDGENLELGDAFTTPDNGTWLQSLGAGQTIEVTTPEGYSVSGTPGATVPLQENAVVIEGPRVFDADERVVVVYSPQPVGPSAPPWTLLAGAIVLAALLIAGGLVGYRRIGADTDDEGSGTGEGSPGVQVDGANGNGSGGAAAVGTTDTADPGPDGDDGEADLIGDDGAEPATDLSLLSDEERVERLLERNGGRMRQADIVAETGWSDAKVSQLLSAMSDDGRVEKLRLGRENLISIPETGTAGDEGDDAEPEGN